MSLEERLRQAGSAVEAEVAAQMDTAKLLADLRRRERVATLRPVAVGVGASTSSIAASGEMEEFARAVVGGDPIAVQRFERAVLRSVEPQSNPTPQRKRRNDVNVTFAHELRRRLAALQVLSEAVEVRATEANADRLVRLLVQELRDLEQLESAMRGSSRHDALEDVDVLETAQSAAETVCWVRKSPIKVQGSKRSLRIRSNPTMLRQALENLIDNAATCSMGAPVDVVVRFSVARRLPGIEVLVADRGPGLGRAPVSRRSGGGVGLQLVRMFAKEAGGRLWSRDREGGGALFGLWLPTGRLSSLAHE
jgi:signal transduction histidine kinase